jgi:hypothetical protein
MFKTKFTLNSVFVMLAVYGLVSVIGCGSSREKQQMSDFLQQYSKTVVEYSDVIKKTDVSKKAEMEEKLNSLMSKWTNMKIEMGNELTPQVLNKLDEEFQRITNEYNMLTHKS